MSTTDSESINITIDDPCGFPGTIAKDLAREDRPKSDCTILYFEDPDKVIVAAANHNAARWLYDWLEDTKQYYRETYDAARGEIDAADQLATEVWNAIQG